MAKKRNRKPVNLEDAGARYLRLGAKKAAHQTVDRLAANRATGSLTVRFDSGIPSGITFQA